MRKKHLEEKIILVFLICAVIIAYPFFAIPYFESNTTWLFVLKYLLAPIIITLLIVIPKFYRKYLETFNRRAKPKANHNFTIVLLVVVITMILGGMCFSLIITTNQWFSSSETVKIKEPVIGSYRSKTRNGAVRNYIEFKDPKSHQIITLNVNKEYQPGDIFEKEMKYGAWGILYSTQ